MKKITEEQFFDLLSLKLSGDATAEQLKLLQEQLLLHPQWQFLYDQMMQSHTSLTDEDHKQQAYALHLVKMELQGKFDAAETADEPEEAPVTVGKRIFSYYKLHYAALAAVLLLGVIFYATRSARLPAHISNFVTRKGFKSRLLLPDGTHVWLNSDSRLSYANNLKGEKREVTLIGEAYFDVVHNAAHPFIIHTGKADIKVLGTAFNVRNYPQDKNLETTLMRGKIEVSLTDRPGEQIVLKPLEKLIVAKNNPDVAVSGKSSASADKVVVKSVTYAGVDSVVAETSWMKDKMIFSNEPLKTIAQELERRYAVTILFENHKAEDYRYTGVFDDESIDKILQIIQLSKKIDYKIDGKTITIK
ncbi:MAG TPA: FecR domain-containing protein [Mucilaginibacter sp.]|nr:FecR domain-containing protein [Mucilaginibacter sp.]